MKRVNLSKTAAFITSGALLAIAISGFSANKVTLAGSSYPSPSVFTTPEIVPIEHEGAEYDGKTKNDYESIDFGEYEYIPNMTIHSYDHVVNNSVYRDAPDGTENNQIYKSLMNAYNLYTTRPVRAFNTEVLTDNLAQDLSGNYTYDSRNFAAISLFELTIDDNREYYSTLLSQNAYTYIKVTFKVYVELEKAPLIIYRCNDYGLDGGTKDTSTTNWSVNQSGSLTKGTGYSLLTYRFYSLCPMFFVGTSASTLELQSHPEWVEEYPLSSGFNTSEFVAPITASLGGGGILAAVLGVVTSLKKKKND